MKITPAVAEELAARPNKAPLKPLGEGDFANQLHAKANAPSAANDPAPERESSLLPLTALSMLPGIKGPIQPLQPLHPAAEPLMPLDASAFSLGRPKPPKSEHDKVQEQSRKWLAQTFYGPMLKQMRESPFKSELFSGGRGGQAFGTMLDQRLADAMAGATDSKLVKSITHKLEGNKAYQKQAGGARPGVPTSAETNPYQNVRIHVAPNLRA